MLFVEDLKRVKESEHSKAVVNSSKLIYFSTESCMVYKM